MNNTTVDNTNSYKGNNSCVIVIGMSGTGKTTFVNVHNTTY